MLYASYEFQRSLLAGASVFANMGANLLTNPLNPLSYVGAGPVVASALDETPAALPLVGYVEPSPRSESPGSQAATPRDPKV